MKWLSLLVLTGSLFGFASGAVAQTQALPTPGKPEGRVQSVLQDEGKINLALMEAALSQSLAAQVEVHDFRWPYNPVPYVSWMSSWVSEGPDGGVETYVVNMTLNKSHVVECYLALNPVSEMARLYACKSNSAKVVPRDFAFANLGLKIEKDRF